MKIPENLNWFKKIRAAVLVVGLKKAMIYSVENGQIELSSQFDHQPIRKNQARLIISRGQGRTFGAVTFKDDLKSKNQERFLKTAGGKINQFLKRRPADRIFLFVHPAFSKKILDTLTVGDRRKIKIAALGNFLKAHPIQLVEKISRLRQKVRDSRQIILHRPEAVKILKHPKAS